MTGLAHCKAVSHINNIISRNLPHVKGFRSTSLVPVNKNSGFGVLKNIRIDSLCFTSKNLHLLPQNKFYCRTRHVLQTE